LKYEIGGKVRTEAETLKILESTNKPFKSIEKKRSVLRNPLFIFCSIVFGAITALLVWVDLEEKADLKAFEHAQSLNTITAYNNYLSEYSLGAYVDDAEQKISNIQKQREFKRLEATRLAQKPQDDAAFRKAKSDGRVRAFGKYAKDFPNGYHIKAADEGAWNSANKQNTIEAYEAYLNYFWVGNFRHKAVPIIASHYKSEGAERLLGVKSRKIKAENRIAKAKARVASGKSGCQSEGCYNGTGLYIYDDGGTYNGRSINGKNTGHGTRHYSDGVAYIGEWENGEKHGNGVYVWEDGEYYVGEFKYGARTGKGSYFYDDGDLYIGQFIKGKRNGFGKFYWIDGDRYYGNYLNNEFHGEGSYYWSDGRKYVGHWKHDDKHGFGKFYASDGTLEYEGQWINDQRAK